MSPVGQPPKRKKTTDEPGKPEKKSNYSLHSFLGTNVTNQSVSTGSKFQLPAGIRVHLGLNKTTAAKLSTQVPCDLPKHNEPLLDCLVGGAVKFGRTQSVDDQDHESLYGGKTNDEGNYLTNFAIEAYLKLIASSSASKGIKVETFGWEEFEKWEGSEEHRSKLIGKKTALMEQDFVLVPVNPSNSQHWVLLVVVPKKREILVLDSLATTFTKPSAVNAVAKML